MANLMHQHPNSGYVNDGHWWHDLNVYLNSQNTGANTSNITIETVVYSDNGAYTQNGTWVSQMWINGGLWVNNSSSHNVGTGATQIGVGSGNVGHDVNGNCTLYVEYYVNEPVTEMSRRGANWTLPRIPLAPSISDVSYTPGTVKPTTTQLRAEISSYGHGTAVTFEMFYRLQGAGSWTSAGQQADVVGYNYWNLTGLKPAKTYEFYVSVWNNNGDTTNSGTSTFKTQSVPGMMPVLIGLTG
jgi:hypothetical protein